MLFFHQRTTLSWASDINTCTSFNAIIILGHISTSDKTFEPFTSQHQQKSASFSRWPPVWLCSVYLCCWLMTRLTLTLLCTNPETLGSCNNTGAWTIVYSSPKETLNWKRTSKKQNETYVNFTPKKKLPEPTQANCSGKLSWRMFCIICFCYLMCFLGIYWTTQFWPNN